MDRVLVVAIGNLGATLEFGVTAEGIETESQLALVRGKGCDVLQGYLFSRPDSAGEFLSLARSAKQRDISHARTGS